MVDTDGNREFTQRRRKEWIAVAIMLLGVFVTYRSPGLFDGKWRLLGIDYLTIHTHRIDFALEQWRANGSIPAWYPREQFGVPFWSNVQSFPFLPMRLVLLPLGVDNVFTLGVYLSLALSALFTYLFARRIGAGVVGAAAAGWTFACSGYFAARILAGHFPLLEGMPSLPILLWTIERLVAAKSSRTLAGWCALVAIECASFCLVGHPQPAFYSLLAAIAYALWRCRGRTLIVTGASMAFGAGMSAFALVPMFRLIQRSSRVLHLDVPDNDIVLSFSRLAAMLFPWRDGAPSQVARPSGVGDFHGYPHTGYFWDTVNYVGWAPLLALVLLGAIAIRTRRRPSQPAIFIAVMGVLALLLALPVAQAILPSVSFTILRSPSRWMYLTTFALSIGLGAAVHALVAAPKAWKMPAMILAVVGVSLHSIDLGSHDRCFVQSWSGRQALPPKFEEMLRAKVGDGRIGMDLFFDIELNRRIDDIGYFDAMVLASTYRGLFDLTIAPPGLNAESIDASALDPRALRACGVRLVMSNHDWPGGKQIVREANVHVYELADVASRVEAFDATSARFLSDDELAKAMRDPKVDPARTLLLPLAAKAELASADVSANAAPTALAFRRPKPDRIEVSLDLKSASWIRVLESFDVGWTATVDGAPIEIVPAQRMAMAISVASGKHELALQFETPGRTLGLALSAISALLMATLALFIARRAN